MKDAIRMFARELGFARVGVTTADPVDVEEHLRAAIAAGRIASMRWLARDPARRCDPAALLPGARSVICCALPYGEDGLPGIAASVSKAEGVVARYARGADYHDVVRTKLESLWDAIHERAPGARAKLCVDTSPILEKALAQRAGIGWIGKHTVLVNEMLGSWFVLGEILTDLELEPDAPALDRCGDCRACLDACPAGALSEPRVLDARRCISLYTTMSKAGSPPESLRPLVDEGVYGCDRCQEACPYNRPAIFR